MKVEYLCFVHAEEKIRSLFVSQRLVIDTNIKGNSPIHCEHKHPLIVGVTCEMVATVKCTVLARREPYVDDQYLSDIVPVPPKEPDTTQSTLES